MLRSSLDHGFRNPPVRWLMLSSPFVGGVAIYAFYAMQPYLLELYRRPRSYALVGLGAAVVAGGQIVGGYLAPRLGKFFRRRTSFLLFGTVASVASLAVVGMTSRLWVALLVLAAWATVFAAAIPIREAFLNGLIPSAERATVLSSDNLLSSAGGVVVQPPLGRIADAWGYPMSYLVGAGIELMALPLILLARREKAPSDAIHERTRTGS